MTEEEFTLAVSRIRSGDKEGLKLIYLAYVKFIYSVIYEVLQNKENTEDVTSEFFIKLWDVADSYQPGNGHKGYLATIARNMAIDFLRKHRREDLCEEPDLGNAYSESGEEEVLSEMSLQEALSHLKDGERQIVNMKVLGEMTFKEISMILHMPMGTVTWKYQNAINKLRRCGYE